DTVRMRDGATLYASKIIASVPQGATFEVEARNRNGAWYLVDYQGIRGWVSAPYVSLLDGRESELVVSTEVVSVPAMGAVFVPGAESGAAVTVRGVATVNLIVRNAASTQGAEIGQVASGTEFVVLGRNTTGAWYLIPFDGGQGWVYSPFVTLIEGRVPDLPIR
ncbi:MAG: SH3 domain-containing protein, partial [Anaerolineae bacterium]|nr:SH3 domain-containing protein [Anaerolineae bacterium]